MTPDDDQRDELPRRRPGMPAQRACEPWPRGPRGGRQDRTIPLPPDGWRPSIPRTGTGTVYPRGWRRLLQRLGRKRWVRWIAESVWFLVLALAAAACASAVSTYILVHR